MRTSLLIALFFSSLGFAQEAEPVFRSDAPLVQLHVTVTDPQGRLITGLPKDDFTVLENDVPQEIKVFRQEDAPVSLGLIIDNSASMKDRRAKVSKAVLDLIRASNPGDEAFIVNFNERPVLAQEFTQNSAQLEATLANIDSQGQTAMRDALSLGLEHLKRLARNDKKVLLVITDGEDNSSSETLAHLSRAASQSGVLIYAIGLLADENERETARAKRDLDALTNGSGGEVFYPQSLSEVDEIALHVAHDLRNQYTIAYSPLNTNQDGSFRKIKVVLASPADAVVKTRAGYYASASM